MQPVSFDRLREIPAGDHRVLSVYLNVPVDPGEARGVPAQLKSLLEPIRVNLDGLSHDVAESLRRDVDAVLDEENRISGLLGRTLAIFRSSALGLAEEFELPEKTRAVAVATSLPYLRPLEAQLGHDRPTCAVIVHKRRARIFEICRNEVEELTEILGDVQRDENHAGWYGLDEYTVRQHAVELAHRQYREIVEAIARLHATRKFDALLLGGRRGAADELRPFLTQPLEDLDAGTFVVDPSTTTPAAVRDASIPLIEQHERTREQRLLDSLLAGAHRSASALGLPRVVAAANQNAVETLVLDRDASAPGGICDGCDWIALDGTECSVCGQPLRASVDVFDALTRKIVSTGGMVHEVESPDGLQEQLVGALLRFPVAQV